MYQASYVITNLNLLLKYKPLPEIKSVQMVKLIALAQLAKEKEPVLILKVSIILDQCMTSNTMFF